MKHHPSPSNLIVKKSLNGLGLFTIKDVRKGSTILRLDGDIISSPTRTSIQIAKNKHVEDKVGGYVNHSCNPNALIYGRSLISLIDIKGGDEITFDYNNNEDILAYPFKCTCCGKKITGRRFYGEV